VVLEGAFAIPDILMERGIKHRDRGRARELSRYYSRFGNYLYVVESFKSEILTVLPLVFGRALSLKLRLNIIRRIIFSSLNEMNVKWGLR
jgi:hypothetical protein